MSFGPKSEAVKKAIEKTPPVGYQPKSLIILKLGAISTPKYGCFFPSLAALSQIQIKLLSSGITFFAVTQAKFFSCSTLKAVIVVMTRSFFNTEAKNSPD
jgi:hypothetical protein